MASIARSASLLAVTGLGAGASAAAAATQTLAIAANDPTTDIVLGSGPAQFSYGLPSNATKSVFTANGTARLGSFSESAAIDPTDTYAATTKNIASCFASCSLVAEASPFLHLKFEIGSNDYFGVADFESDGTLNSITYAAAVPEPASWALLVGGFGFVGAALRRSRREAALA